MATMDVEQYVAALYQLALDRAPEPDGLRAWASIFAEDPTAVLAGILASDEYRARFASVTLAEDERVLGDKCKLALTGALCGRPLTIVDVGAQTLAGEEHVYQPLCQSGLPYQIIGFEPLEDQLQKREAAEGNGSLVMLPHAIGDGERHVLHINNDDGTSSLFPLNEPLCARFESLDHLRTVRQLEVATHRLDDVLTVKTVDFLKLDIQGAELMALKGAEKTLASTAVVHCEVEFEPIYRGQPLYPEVQAYMNACGFVLIDLIIPHRYAYSVPSHRFAHDRLLWGEAVFFRETENAATLAAQALAALRVYDKPTLAEHLLTRIDGRVA